MLSIQIRFFFPFFASVNKKKILVHLYININIMLYTRNALSFVVFCNIYGNCKCLLNSTFSLVCAEPQHLEIISVCCQTDNIGGILGTCLHYEILVPRSYYFFSPVFIYLFTYYLLRKYNFPFSNKFHSVLAKINILYTPSNVSSFEILIPRNPALFIFLGKYVFP